MLGMNVTAHKNNMNCPPEYSPKHAKAPFSPKYYGVHVCMILYNVSPQINAISIYINNKINNNVFVYFEYQNLQQNVACQVLINNNKNYVVHINVKSH